MIEVYTNVLQEENIKSKLEVRQKQQENPEDIKPFTNLQDELKSQLESQLKYSEDARVCASQLQEENFKLKTRVNVMQKVVKNFDDIKVHTNILQEENSDLKSQLEITQEQLKNSIEEKTHYFNKYRELKDQESCDVADMVCTYVTDPMSS